MTNTARIIDDARVQGALTELQELISVHYPAAVFTTAHGEDPEGIYLTVTVDVEDIDEVVAVFIARLIELQVEHEWPVYVVPVEPLARVIAAQTSRARPVAYADAASAAS